LVNAVLYNCGDELNVSNEKRPGIVHRLDKETSGVILVAKHDRALDYLQTQFKERTIKKEYLALVDGHIKPENALIDAPIGRDTRQRKKMAVIRPNSSATSRPAQTQYKLEMEYEDFSLVRCFPFTGRTHQIRVHLAYAGYPIVGDAVYGRRKQQMKLKRHFLHAAKITFQRPSDGETLSFEAPLPPELQQILDKFE
jgi:23S rRNA pseudouridine1911/1915/1917 synthase